MKNNNDSNAKKDVNKDKNKEIYYLKIKQYQKAPPYLSRREFPSSILSNYDKINEIIIDLIKTRYEKEKTIDNHIPIIILNHPEIKEIFLNSKEEWSFYYEYNIIDECIINKSLKIDFLLIKTGSKSEKIINIQKKDSTQKVIKYIIEKIPINIFLKILLNFLKTSNNISKIFQQYLINVLINDDTYSYKNNQHNLAIVKEDILNENININSIIDEENDNKNNENKYKNKNINNKTYYFDNEDFITILNDNFKKFSEYENYLNNIKSIIKEENEEINKNIIKEKNVYNTSLQLAPTKSIEHLLKDDDSYEIVSKNLMSVLNPPSKSVSKLLNEENFFKKIDKGEYYIGLEEYKDKLSRESIEILNKNS